MFAAASDGILSLAGCEVWESQVRAGESSFSKNAKERALFAGASRRAKVRKTIPGHKSGSSIHPGQPRPDDTTLPTAHPDRERRRDRHDGFDARHVEHRVRVDGAMCMWLTSTPRTRSIARESLFEGSFHGGSGYVGHSSRVLVR